ncbi:MAG: hypothetical protein ABIJ00_00875 [Candidatus Eisenbacteria bacterium]
MGRKILLFVVMGLLTFGLLGIALAETPPRRDYGGDPGPRPLQWGDPDWPSYSREAGVARRLAVEDADATIRPDGMDAHRARFGSAGHVRDRHGAPSRRYVVRVLGLTIVIRR